MVEMQRKKHNGLDADEWFELAATIYAKYEQADTVNVAKKWLNMVNWARSNLRAAENLKESVKRDV
jgi:hypothetical protein